MLIHTYFTNYFTSVQSSAVRQVQLGSLFFWSFKLSFQSLTAVSIPVEERERKGWGRRRWTALEAFSLDYTVKQKVNGSKTFILN